MNGVNNNKRATYSLFSSLVCLLHCLQFFSIIPLPINILCCGKLICVMLGGYLYCSPTMFTIVQHSSVHRRSSFLHPPPTQLPIFFYSRSTTGKRDGFNEVDDEIGYGYTNWNIATCHIITISDEVSIIPIIALVMLLLTWIHFSSRMKQAARNSRIGIISMMIPRRAKLLLLTRNQTSSVFSTYYLTTKKRKSDWLYARRRWDFLCFLCA